MILGLAATLPGALYHGLMAQGVSRGHGRQGLAPPAGRQPLRRLPGLQPDADPARLVADVAATRPGQLPHQPELLPPPDLGAFSGLTEAFTFRGGRLPDRRRGLVAAGRQVPPRRCGRGWGRGRGGGGRGGGRGQRAPAGSPAPEVVAARRASTAPAEDPIDAASAGVGDPEKLSHRVNPVASRTCWSIIWT